MSATERAIGVELGARSYEIVIQAAGLDEIGSRLTPLLHSRDLLIVTDSNVARTAHLRRLQQALGNENIAFRTFCVQAGEASKSLDSFGSLLEEILTSGIDRRTALVALGGGVVGDLGGFAAATLLRGIDFFQIPTTLLSQVDSSVGGKTGINSRAGKNLIGAFHQPRLVLIDPTTLEGLPLRELRAGYAELVKHAFIRDADLFEWLDEHVEKIIPSDASVLDLDLIADAVDRSVRIKAEIVGLDERESTGWRALLNFGHTFGHAFETIAGYDGRLLHGEAVALGMIKAFELSMRLQNRNGADLSRAKTHLERAGLPVHSRSTAIKEFDAASMLKLMAHDKKSYGGKLNLILSRQIGEAFLAKDVPDEEVGHVLN